MSRIRTAPVLTDESAIELTARITSFDGGFRGCELEMLVDASCIPDYSVDTVGGSLRDDESLDGCYEGAKGCGIGEEHIELV
jgi:hypothetical protein